MFKSMMLAFALMMASATSAGPQAAEQVEVPVAVQEMVQARAGEDIDPVMQATRTRDRVQGMLQLRQQICDGEQARLGNEDGEPGTGNAYGWVEGLPYGQAKKLDPTLLPFGQQIQAGEAEIPGLGNAYGHDPDHVRDDVDGECDGECDGDGECDDDGVPDGNAYGYWRKHQ